MFVIVAVAVAFVAAVLSIIVVGNFVVVFVVVIALIYVEFLRRTFYFIFFASRRVAFAFHLSALGVDALTMLCGHAHSPSLIDFGRLKVVAWRLV